MFEEIIPPQWQSWLDEHAFYGVNAAEWAMAFAVFLAAAVALWFIRVIIAQRAERLSRLTKSIWDDCVVEALRNTKFWFVLIVAAYLASFTLDFPEAVDARTRLVIQKIVVLALLLQAALWGNLIIACGLRKYVERRAAQDPAGITTVSALAFVGKLVLFSLLLLLALDNLGVDVTALITGLGVGGIAVALAVQNILGDLLASLSIVFDKPFVIGDFIIVGDQMGSVEKIGLKTTRLRSLSGEQLVFANNDLLQSRIRNFKRMAERRVVFSVGVTYDTPRSKLLAIPQVLRTAVENRQAVRFDRAHFKEFGAFSLNYEVVYYVLSADYTQYMDIQQAINFEIHERFEDMEVEFAFPTQTLYLNRSSSSGDASA